MRPLSNIADSFLADRNFWRSLLGLLLLPFFSLGILFSRARKAFRSFLQSARPLPHGLGSVLALAFVLTGWGYGAVRGGHDGDILAGSARVVGLTADDVHISGQRQTSVEDVVIALGLARYNSLVGFDVAEARERLLALPWISAAKVRKLYPGKVVVDIEERSAFAIWQNSDHLMLVEETGAPIVRLDIAGLIDNKFGRLPHLVGTGAAEKAAESLPVASRHEALANRVQAYVRVSGRRWSLQFANGVKVHLPETGLSIAFERLAELQKGQQVLDRDITDIDLRLSDRVALRLGEGAMAARTEFVSQRAKAMRKAEQRS